MDVNFQFNLLLALVQTFHVNVCEEQKPHKHDHLRIYQKDTQACCPVFFRTVIIKLICSVGLSNI